jgi:hypothetical protein
MVEIKKLILARGAICFAKDVLKKGTIPAHLLQKSPGALEYQGQYLMKR